ncbi:hypothetical protein PGTUg99_011933 [Puccinia graminis f. sp. tritici]|uniref:Uncharacterized protein n=1 Tax=Puccinia graminis f. sp. tritici TaxID=56615 RepID=A0A5B0MRX2_PUCGR|nr:hypothetical protein PGTUg99_011933 [Puccinia graminis f. sp. tritici]
MQFSDFFKVLLVVLLHLTVPCAASNPRYFLCGNGEYKYCAYKDYSTQPMKYKFGPASQVTREGRSTCSVSQLPSKSIIDVCCDNPVGLLKPRRFGTEFTVSDNDYKNRFKCREASPN